MGRLAKFIYFYGEEETDLPKQYKRVKGFVVDNNGFWEIKGLKLSGSDTVRFSFSATNRCNVFGCYTTNAAGDNYSLYVSTSSNAKYLRYNGGTFASYFSPANLDKRFDVVITPTGTKGMPLDSTWEEKNFTSSVDMCIGTSSTSATSASLKGKLYGEFIVDGRFKGIPCERVSDGAIGYYDTYSKTFFEETGSGAVVIR